MELERLMKEHKEQQEFTRLEDESGVVEERKKTFVINGDSEATLERMKFLEGNLADAEKMNLVLSKDLSSVRQEVDQLRVETEEAMEARKEADAAKEAAESARDLAVISKEKAEAVRDEALAARSDAEDLLKTPVNTAIVEDFQKQDEDLRIKLSRSCSCQGGSRGYIRTLNWTVNMTTPNLYLQTFYRFQEEGHGQFGE